MAKFLITGAAGFIGAAVAHELMILGHDVVGIDNFRPDYPTSLKQHRVDTMLAGFPSWSLRHENLLDLSIPNLIKENAYPFDAVIHLAGLAGVRQSVERPVETVGENVLGMLKALEIVRTGLADRIVYASSSSVYSPTMTLGKTTYPVSTDNEPRTPYAASKRMLELLAHSYANAYGAPSVGLRFFSVYGPAGRPDSRASIFQYIRQIDEGEPVTIFGSVEQARDFTYIDDVVDLVIDATLRIPPRSAPDRILDAGFGKPVKVFTVLQMLSEMMGKPLTVTFKIDPQTDTETTCATVPDEFKAFAAISTTLEVGLQNCVNWYRENREWARLITP